MSICIDCGCAEPTHVLGTEEKVLLRHVNQAHEVQVLKLAALQGQIMELEAQRAQVFQTLKQTHDARSQAFQMVMNNHKTHNGQFDFVTMTFREQSSD